MVATAPMLEVNITYKEAPVHSKSRKATDLPAGVRVHPKQPVIQRDSTALTPHANPNPNLARLKRDAQYCL